VNDCLSDAVAYLGEGSVPLRHDMQDAVCFALGGAPGKRTSNAPSCNFASSETEDDSSANLALISESLGSKILFDAIRELQDAQTAAAPDEESTLGLLAALSRSQSIFLLANQLPLLGLADGPGEEMSDEAAPGSLSEGIDLILFAKDNGPDYSGIPEKLEIVAFSDPNDLLSYRLLPSMLDVTDAEKVRIFNVIASNNATWFGFVANPDSAHTTYLQQAGVESLLVNGND
jgi:hypothetical protein